LRALALHADVIVLTSQFWQTTCTAVRSGGEGFVVDSPVYPEELQALPELLEQAAFPVSGLLTTHADWDHLLSRLAFPDASLGCAETTAARLRAEPGVAQRELREFDEEHYVSRARPLSLTNVQALPVPGRLALGAGEELERLQPVLDCVQTVVPGHGGPCDRDGALRLLEEDVRYLSDLRRMGAGTRLPPGRVTGAQKRIHEENAERVGDATAPRR
jgi:glyoxylase-like metal-dependent hydrolase (beta-lactamase superfamily II)